MELGADLLTLSAHKIGGPKGVGALVLPRRYQIGWSRCCEGGGQERGRRAGTENVAGIAGFGAAAAVAMRGWRTMAAHGGLARPAWKRACKAAVPGGM